MYSLTEKGKADMAKTARNYAEYFLNCHRFYTSPALRCIESLKQITHTLHLPVLLRVTELIDEMDPGILGDVSHVEAERRYGNYYKIWLERKDLDGIPDAETGNQLQARALAFAVLLLTESKQSAAVITHAGFMRCLVNTLSDRQRNTPVNIQNAEPYLIDVPDDYLDKHIKSRGENAVVYKFRTQEHSFSVKLSLKELSDAQISVQNKLSRSGYIPKIYLIGNFRVGEQICSCTVSDWVDGVHLHGEADEALLMKMADVTVRAQNELCKIKVNASALMTVEDKIRYCFEGNDCSALRPIGETLIGKYSSHVRMFQEPPVLSFYDLHRDNYIMDSQQKIYMLDTESLLLAAPSFSCACFLATALLEGQHRKDCAALPLVFNVPPKYHELLSIEIFIRIYIGISFYFRYNDRENPILRKYLLVFLTLLTMPGVPEWLTDEESQRMESAIRALEEKIGK